MRRFLTLAGLLVLAACGRDDARQEQAAETADTTAQVPGSEVADTLEDAAGQSGPRAKSVLREAASEARGRESMAPVDEPGSFAQDAMERAGEAEASGPVSAPSSGAPSGR